MKQLVKSMGILSVLAAFFMPNFVMAAPSKVESILARMSVKEKIAQMIMPAFESSCESGDCNMTEISPGVAEILRRYNFAGVILFGQNITGTEQITRLIDALQRANNENANSKSQLLIAMDQEGGYITRLAYGTSMPGNMALGATNDASLAYQAAQVIGGELNAVGVNTDFAPVSDVNNNPANPIIGVRSFSDSPEKVGEYAGAFMKGLQSNDIITALKHFPGHGDTATDTHSSMTVVDKSYDELKALELVPFQRLIDEKTDMIMTAHIQYPQIENTTYVSKKDGSEIYLPATLSKKIITDVLRGDMHYNGVVVTDALNMGTVANHFERLDVAKLAINAGVDILLMPVNANGDTGIEALDDYIGDVTDLVENGEISEDKVDAAVKRILTLKDSKGLLDTYSVDIEAKVADALKTVSTKESHEKEFEIAKKAITLVKNENEALPLNGNDETLILYEYGSHLNAINYVMNRLIANGVINNTDNVRFFKYDGIDTEEVKAQIRGAKNVVVINALYGLNYGNSFGSAFSANMESWIDFAHENGAKVVFMSTQLPYDVARFNKADAIVVTYLANGIAFEGLENYESNIPKYGANVIAGLYQLFDRDANMSGKLPVNIYVLGANYSFSDEVLYARGHGLTYKLKDEDVVEDDTGRKDEAEKGAGGEEISTIAGMMNDHENVIRELGVENSLGNGLKAGELPLAEGISEWRGVEGSSNKTEGGVNIGVMIAAVMIVLGIMGGGIYYYKNRRA